jgi:hypothetical protein
MYIVKIKIKLLTATLLDRPKRYPMRLLSPHPHERVLRGAATPFRAYVGALFSFKPRALLAVDDERAAGGGGAGPAPAVRPPPRASLVGFAFMSLQWGM